jgi:hypothetical protein
MEIQALNRIRFVTQYFNDLQGLRYWVPLGLITLSGGGVLHFASRLAEVLLAISFPGAFLLAFGAKRYYRRTFGEVERQPALKLSSVSIFSPAGPVPRLEGFQQMTPIAQCFLVTTALVISLFSIFQAIPPNIMVLGNESLGQQPRVLSLDAYQAAVPFKQPETIVGAKAVAGHKERPWSMRKAVFGQTLYALYGSLFLSLWLWRERHRSQSHHLAFAILMLGLSAFGTSLGFLVRDGREIPGFTDLFLPALVYPGIALLLCGSSMILAGLLDHWQLARAMGRPMAPRAEV